MVTSLVAKSSGPRTRMLGSSDRDVELKCVVAVIFAVTLCIAGGAGGAPAAEYDDGDDDDDGAKERLTAATDDEAERPSEERKMAPGWVADAVRRPVLLDSRPLRMDFVFVVV
jgi:hypothetical protein